MKFLRRFILGFFLMVTVVCLGAMVMYDLAKEFYNSFANFPFLLVLATSVGIIVILLVWEMIAKSVTITKPHQKNSKSSVAIAPHQSSCKAKDTFDDYDRFMQGASDSARKTLDD